MSREPLTPLDPRATPYAVLGFADARFDVDEKELERAWLDRSRKVHPDRFATAPDAQRRLAAEHTVALNQAYKTLKDPWDRAVWLVRAAGIDPAVLDQALLVELMELREEADEGPAPKAAVIARAAARFAALASVVAERLARQDTVPQGYASATDGLRQVAQKLAEMKTLARLVDDLGGGKLITTLDGR